MMNPYYSGWVAGGIENNANSVQLQLPTGTELGNNNNQQAIIREQNLALVSHILYICQKMGVFWPPFQGSIFHIHICILTQPASIPCLSTFPLHCPPATLSVISICVKIQ